MKVARTQAGIWALALGYFLCYIPYSMMVKSVSNGLLPGMGGPVQGLRILPGALVGTGIGFLAYLLLSGRWRDAGRIGRRGIPMASNASTWISGLSAAVIIATTTLAYCFTGVSIIFALLLMRGGVLALAPIIDRMFGRRVNWYSWVALGLSLLALLVAILDQSRPEMTLMVMLNILAYLGGYLVRLQTMTHVAKTDDAARTRQYFAEEMMVAGLAILLVPVLLLAIFPVALQDFGRGYREMLDPATGLPCIGIGLLYAALYLFGTQVYLDQRENSFCIPVNRCASLLSGVSASLLLGGFTGTWSVTAAQWAGAGIVLMALLVLSTPIWWPVPARQPAVSAERLFVFICSGNTSRSPLAQALCADEMARRLSLSPASLATHGLRIQSAGIAAHAGAPLEAAARHILDAWQVSYPAHAAQNLSAAQAAEAERIWCMSDDQVAAVQAQFPEAAHKVARLDPQGDIANPHGKPIEVMQAIAMQIRTAVGLRLTELFAQPGATPSMASSDTYARSTTR